MQYGGVVTPGGGGVHHRPPSRPLVAVSLSHHRRPLAPACGLAAGPAFAATVMPFILRNVPRRSPAMEGLAERASESLIHVRTVGT